MKDYRGKQIALSLSGESFCRKILKHVQPAVNSSGVSRGLSYREGVQPTVDLPTTTVRQPHASMRDASKVDFYPTAYAG